MQRGVVGFGFRAGVAAAALGQLDAAQVFDVGAIVELAGMASGGVADDQRIGPPCSTPKRAGPDLVDHDSLALDRV